MDANEIHMDFEEDSLIGRILTFHIHKETYGIEISFVTEIVSIQDITEIPEMPDYMKGIINLRGKIIPVMDVRRRFNIAPRDYDDRTCVVVIELNGTNVGLIVDSVSEVITIQEEDLTDLQQANFGISNRYVKKIGQAAQKVILILSCERLLSAEELADISTVV
jgi:purine-binding chemotaxis protein CheW